MDNNFKVDLCVMDSIIIVRALNRERLALMELIKFQKEKEDEANRFINEKRLVRTCCLLDKIEKAMKEIPEEKIQNNYWDDKLSMQFTN